MPMPPTEVLGTVEQPFPGLRPFEAEESLLFFGREPHVEELLRSLGGSRFLAVIGASGSGKSSLVRAGLLPALYRGYLAGSTTRWRIAVMRPGTAPMANLCQALSGEGALGPGDEARRRALLSSSSMGLVEAVEDARLPAGEGVLVVVDQFEELFRYRRQAYRDDGGAEASLFVSLLLAAPEQFRAPIYIVLTMRSDFLGECTEFPGLAEALSRSQYLVPRLTREQRRQAIEKPLRLAGAGITTRGLQQVLNDWGDEPTADPLPLLQHALTRTFRQWKESGRQGNLDLPDYRAAGGMEGALDAHAEAVFASLDGAGKLWTEKIFRALTATELGRRIRRPSRLDRLYKVVGAATDSERGAVDAVLRKFLERSNALLVASTPGELRPDTVLDIPHESLIAKWKQLEGWTRREAVSAEWYIDAANGAALFARREGALWRDPTLARALGFAKSEGWNEDWAALYRPDGNPGFADVQSFLKRSWTAQRFERALWLAAAAVVLAALVIAGVFYFREMRLAESNRALRNRVTQIQAEQAAEDAKIQDYEKQLQALSFDKSLTASQKAQREQELQAQLASSQAEATRLLKAQQDQKAKVLNEKTDLATVNSALQEQLDAANREIARLKSAASLNATPPPRTPDTRLNPKDGPGSVRETAAPRAGNTRINPTDGLTYIWIPPGSFTMGCSPGDTECRDSEKPPRAEQIANGFWLGQTEVTQAAWRRVMNNDRSHFKGNRLPVESVDWNQANAYCKAIGGRLPTEREWEYAARAGTMGPRYGALDVIAWFNANSGDRTHPVGQKQANAYGLYDMLGSVWEWTSDNYGAGMKVLRGGSWSVVAMDARASYRVSGMPSAHNNNIGFRCAGEFR